MTASSKANLGLSLLSWKSPATFRQTLNALSSIPDDIFSDKVIFFQEISDEDKAVAKEFGYRAEGNDKNQGIREGIKQAISANMADIVLFLENDCLLIEQPETARTLLEGSAQAIAEKSLNVVRLRHIRQPGEDYSNYHKFLRYWPSENDTNPMNAAICGLRRLIRPDKAKRYIGESVIDSEQADKRFPQWIEKLSPDLFKIDSAVMKWTNQSIMVDKAWFLEVVIPFAEANPSLGTVNGFQDLEREMRSRWWRKQHFKIGHAIPGLFTHHRLDRPDGDEKTLLHEPIEV